MGQHWLGNTKPKKSFQIKPKHFQNIATEFFLKKLFNGILTN